MRLLLILALSLVNFSSFAQNSTNTTYLRGSSDSPAIDTIENGAGRIMGTFFVSLLGAPLISGSVLKLFKHEERKFHMAITAIIGGYVGFIFGAAMPFEFANSAASIFVNSIIPIIIGHAIAGGCILNLRRMSE